MRERKISRLILSMTDHERSKLNFWIRDSQSRSEILKMTYQVLSRRLAGNKPFTEADLFRDLFPDLPEEDARRRLSNHLTRLRKEVVRFIAIVELGEDEFHETFNLLKYYSRRGLDAYYPNTLKKLRALLDAQADSPEKLHQQLLLSIEQISFNVTRGKKEENSFFDQANQVLDHYWLFRTLQLTCAAREYDAHYGTQHPDRKTEILELVKRLGRDKLPAFIRLQLFIYELQESLNHDEHPFETLMGAIKSANVADKEIQQFYGFAINILTRLINRGNLDLQLVLVRLYRDAFREGSGFTPQIGNYKNRIFLLSRLGEAAEAHEVLNALSKIYGKDSTVALLCRAQIAFDEGKYKKAIQNSNDISSADATTLWGLDAAVLQWKAAVMGGKEDADLYDLISSKYDNLRMRILRAKRISAEHRDNYRNLLKLFQRFVSLQSNPPENLRQELVKLHAEVNETERIANKQWVLDTIQQALDDL